MLRTYLTILIVLVPAGSVLADGLIYRWEGDVLPYDPSAGWIIADPCNDWPGGCTESLGNGRLRLSWPKSSGGFVYYFNRIAQPPDAPPSLWVEWGFRSNRPLGPNLIGCNGYFSIHYKRMVDLAYMDGDAVVSFEGSDYLLGLAVDEFHTYRFESSNGVRYCFWVDGINVWCGVGSELDNGYHSIQFGGGGGCISDWIPNSYTEWDYVRYGTVGYGEAVSVVDPPTGDVPGAMQGTFDRIVVTFDSPNYVYLEQITIESTPLNNLLGEYEAPSAVAVMRNDDMPLETVEIVLDKPLPRNARTTITINDGTRITSLIYSQSFGDADADGLLTRLDIPDVVSCLTGPNADAPAPCRYADSDHDLDVDLCDMADAMPMLLSAVKK